MSIDGKMTDYQIVQQYLPRETMMFLRGKTYMGTYSIMARWAINNLDKFLKLAEDEIALLERANRQEDLEEEALLSPRGEELFEQGFSSYEVLTYLGINPNL